jgi:hypothetical protein
MCVFSMHACNLHVLSVSDTVLELHVTPIILLCAVYRMDVCAHGDVEHHPGRYFGQGKRKVEYCRSPVTCTLAED